MPIAARVSQAIERSSWIRKMFEEGATLKALKGAQNVFDFSLGNPNLPPPPKFYETLEKLSHEKTPGIHGYMPNAGFEKTRDKVAERSAREQLSPVKGGNIIMTVGAGGGLNTIFRAILEPGDEIVVPKPYFVEYNFYAENHGGVITAVPTKENFDLDLSLLAEAITIKSRAVLINTPNNPTGKVYTQEQIEKLGELLTAKSKEFGRTIYLISDEPYRAIAFDGIVVPPIMPSYSPTLICSSFSKDLSLAGERIGYIAINPSYEKRELLFGALCLTNRILGFVNAPALAQRLVAELMDERVDIDYYQTNRDLLHEGLINAGYTCEKPEGAFYLFPKSPIPDDVAFCKELLKENILAVPGTGFFGPGHIRLAYCCSKETVEGSIAGFARTIKAVKG